MPDFEVPEEGFCFNCSAPLDDDYFCYGCEEFVCDECNVSGAWGDHTAEDHLIADWDDEEDDDWDE